MNRRKNPLSIILLGVLIIISFVGTYFLIDFLPSSVQQYKQLIFWIIVVAFLSVGGILIGKKFGGQ